MFIFDVCLFERASMSKIPHTYTVYTVCISRQTAERVSERRVKPGTDRKTSQPASSPCQFQLLSKRARSDLNNDERHGSGTLLGAFPRN